MRSARVSSAFGLAVAIAFASQSVAPSFAGSAESQIVSRELQSANFAHNKIGTNPVRKMAVYLPGGHEGSSIRYPVIYFLPSPLGSYRSHRRLDQDELPVRSGQSSPFLSAGSS